MRPVGRRTSTSGTSPARLKSAAAGSVPFAGIRPAAALWRRALICVVTPILISAMAGVSAREFSSYASVAEDGSLRVGNRKVHLYGIYLPPSGQHCTTLFSPRVCGSRAAVALDFKIQGFVHCKQKRVNRDRSITAVCYVNHSHSDEGEDLGAYLIQQGWAMALPDAPFEYHAMEKIARSQSRGIWGFTIDGVQRRSTRP